MKLGWLIVVFCTACCSVLAQSFYQNRRYADFGGGVVSYWGDLRPFSSVFIPQRQSFNFTMGISYEISPIVWLRGGLSWFRLQASDIDESGREAFIRNLHFRNDLIELSATGQLDLMGEKHFFREGKVKPYLLAGIAGIYSRPMAKAPLQFGGGWRDLKSQGTEGQHFGMGRRYSRINLAFPIGIGMEFRLSEHWQMSSEFFWRLTTTDYLDDVSGKYVDLSLFGENKLAAAFSDRTTETLGGIRQKPRRIESLGVAAPLLYTYGAGQWATYGGYNHPENPYSRRGDEKAFDSYFGLQLRFKYKLPLTKRQLIPRSDYPLGINTEVSPLIYEAKTVGRFEIKLLAINTKDSEIAVALQNRGLLFLSDIPQTRFFKPRLWHRYFHRYYFTTLTDLDRNELTTSVKFLNKVNNQMDYFTGSFDEYENEFYFSAFKDFTSDSKEKIYRAIVIDTKRFGRVAEVELPNFLEHASHPYVSHDGQTLYFTSKGIDNQFDIYVCYRDSTAWTTPYKLPYPINTPYNEIYPTLHYDGTLYFSSDRPGGLGAMDIYEVTNLDFQFPTVERLPAPINSPFNDYNLLLNNYKRFGIFTSDREGGVGEEDIYSIKVNQLSSSTRLLSDTTNLRKSQEIIVIGRVINSRDRKPIASAIVKCQDLMTDAIDIYFTDKNGYFTLLLTNDCSYKFGVSAQGYEPSRDTLLATVGVQMELPQIELDFMLEERVFPSRFYGHVMNTDSIPLEKVRITIKDLSTEETEETLTDKDGAYQFTINTRHSYLIIFQAEGYKPWSFRLNSHQGDFAENVCYNPILEKLAD